MKNLIMASAICALMFSGLSAADKPEKKEHKHHLKKGEVCKVDHHMKKGHKAEKPCGEKPCRHETTCKKHRGIHREHHGKMHGEHMTEGKHHENMYKAHADLGEKIKEARKHDKSNKALELLEEHNELSKVHHKHKVGHHKTVAEHHKKMAEKKHKEHLEK